MTETAHKGPTEAGAIADLVLKTAREPVIVEGDGGRRYLVAPTDYVVSKEFLADAHGLITDPPPRIKQAVTVQTTDSLVEYVNRFKSDDTVLFADITSSRIVAEIDYHAPGSATGAFLDHAATLQLPFSEEWNTWTKNAGLKGQLEFARFIEENAVDVIAPSGAELLEVCRDLQAHRKVNFIKAVRTASDNENFEYADETTASSKRGAVEVPAKFQLSLPVYFGEPPTTLYAFLRWKLDEAALSLGYVLHRAEHVRQAVFKQIVIAAAERTGQPVVFGRAR